MGEYRLETLAAEHGICRLAPSEELPSWAAATPGAIFSVTRTAEELSIVCAETLPPPGVVCSRGWRAIRIAGTLEHTLTGVLVALAAPLAEAEIPIFAISSFDTDYLLVPGNRFEAATEVLTEAGHSLA